MKNNKISFLVLLLTFAKPGLFAQEMNDSLVTKSNLKLYCTLYHQHHDILGKVFSFQGLEGGVILNRKVFLGLYCSFFASNLKAKINGESQFVWIGQSGISNSYVFFEKCRIHPGCQLNAGFFTLRYDENDFRLSETGKAEFKLNGFVLSPQIFGEFNVVDWLKIRTGLSYNFYFFKGLSIVKPSDLNHISFTFGMVFCGI